jgi:hypothetical protein
MDRIIGYQIKKEKSENLRKTWATELISQDIPMQRRQCHAKMKKQEILGHHMNTKRWNARKAWAIIWIRDISPPRCRVSNTMQR